MNKNLCLFDHWVIETEEAVQESSPKPSVKKTAVTKKGPAHEDKHRNTLTHPMMWTRKQQKTQELKIKTAQLPHSPQQNMKQFYITSKKKKKHLKKIILK